ncbi:uncharacterized protein LOC135825246 [Sycon ciliatum]|uniref:uncharacterized protein LOC135825246 n=1 Tax=Sycon ciliatum TaxID=27933 RepID=UPI0020A8FA2B|eukprot:scpid75768/ scgid11565/ Serum response factor homolog A; DsSRF
MEAETNVSEEDVPSTSPRGSLALVPSSDEPTEGLRAHHCAKSVTSSASQSAEKEDCEAVDSGEEQLCSTSLSESSESSLNKLTRPKKSSLRFITQRKKRNATFRKRKGGLMKKGFELSKLTSAEVLVMVSTDDGLFSFGTRRLRRLLTAPLGKEIVKTCLHTPLSDTSETANSDKDVWTGDCIERVNLSTEAQNIDNGVALMPCIQQAQAMAAEKPARPLGMNPYAPDPHPPRSMSLTSGEDQMSQQLNRFSPSDCNAEYRNVMQQPSAMTPSSDLPSQFGLPGVTTVNGNAIGPAELMQSAFMGVPPRSVFEPCVDNFYPRRDAVAPLPNWYSSRDSRTWNASPTFAKFRTP